MRIGIFYDVENLKDYTSVKSAIERVKYLTKNKNIVINQAYTDWGIQTNNIRMEFIKNGIVLKQVITNSGISNIINNASDIALSIDAIEAAFKFKIDEFYVISGDGGFVNLVIKLKELGKIINIISKKNVLSNTLKIYTDNYFIIDDDEEDPDKRYQKSIWALLNIGIEKNKNIATIVKDLLYQKLIYDKIDSKEGLKSEEFLRLIKILKKEITKEFIEQLNLYIEQEDNDYYIEHVKKDFIIKLKKVKNKTRPRPECRKIFEILEQDDNIIFKRKETGQVLNTIIKNRELLDIKNIDLVIDAISKKLEFSIDKTIIKSSLLLLFKINVMNSENNILKTNIKELELKDYISEKLSSYLNNKNDLSKSGIDKTWINDYLLKWDY